MLSSTLIPDLDNANEGRIASFWCAQIGCTLFFRKGMTQMKIETKKLTLSAVMIALSAVLSLVKVYELLLGGSITLLSMLPVAVIAICYGTKWGLFCSTLYAFVQIALDAGKLMGYGMTAGTWAGCLMFDYIIAFGALGLAGLFRKKGTIGMCAGITLALVIRFISHFISGSIVFSVFCPEGWNVFFYSFCYNGSYMLPELIITIIGAVLLFRIPQVRKLIEEKQ
jgi:thiamine transporter